MYRINYKEDKEYMKEMEEMEEDSEEESVFKNAQIAEKPVINKDFLNEEYFNKQFYYNSLIGENNNKYLMNNINENIISRNSNVNENNNNMINENSISGESNNMIKDNNVMYNSYCSSSISYSSESIQSSLNSPTICFLPSLNIPFNYEGEITLMIKNIPNKLKSIELIEIINKISFGKYDFLYLRMDFRNNCNTGYAFINIINKKEMNLFYSKFNGYRWINKNSNKIVELVYAKIQGRDNLIRKFKTSNVMNQVKEYRPQLFYISGENIGKEKLDFN